jgi:fructose-1,6-bisphosphatase/inositol monophosphatase family enzyme
MDSKATQERIRTLPSHVFNIYRMVRDYYSSISLDELNQDEDNEQAVQTLELNCETVIIDYLFKNFKSPIRIHTASREPIENKEGTPELAFVILPLSSLHNFMHSIRLCGFGIYVCDATRPFCLDSIHISLIGNVFTGDHFIATPDKAVYYNNNLIESYPSDRISHPILACSLSGGVTLPTLKRFHQLASKFPELRNFGSYLIEAGMLMLSQVNSFIDITYEIPFKHQLAILYMFKQLDYPMHDEYGNEISSLTPDPDESISIISSMNTSLHKRIMKTLKKRATS